MSILKTFPSLDFYSCQMTDLKQSISEPPGFKCLVIFFLSFGHNVFGSPCPVENTNYTYKCRAEGWEVEAT